MNGLNLDCRVASFPRLDRDFLAYDLGRFPRVAKCDSVPRSDRGDDAMRPRKQSSGQDNLFRTRLDQIIGLRHEMVRLAGLIDWQLIGRKLCEVYTHAPGQPPLPARLMAGLAILKHTHNLSDETLCDCWVENPYYQHFCGAEHFLHTAPFDRSSLLKRLAAEATS